ncbi:MAG: 50S ribosomal protein L28 [Parcubacteria group bacterium]|nr:50S ribosomal protein L28 [Parcubacteria group bacterium]
MARTCDLCQRGSNKIYSRSKSHISTIKRQHVNLQNKKINGMRVRICTRCIKSIKKTEAKAVAK